MDVAGVSGTTFTMSSGGSSTASLQQQIQAKQQVLASLKAGKTTDKTTAQKIAALEAQIQALQAQLQQRSQAAGSTPASQTPTAATPGRVDALA